QGKIQRVIAAKAASGNRDLRSPVLPLQVRQKLVGDVTLVLHMPRDACPRRHALVVPTLAVDAVHAEQLNRARFQFSGQRADHSRVFILEKTPHGGRKNQDRLPGVPEHQRLHVASQFLAILLVVFTVHVPRIVNELRGFRHLSGNKGQRQPLAVLSDQFGLVEPIFRRGLRFSSTRPLPEPRLHLVEVYIVNRRDVEGYDLRKEETAYDRQAQASPRVGARAKTNRDGQGSHQGRHGGHHDGTEADERALIDGFLRTLSFLPLRFQSEVNHHDGILFYDADEHDDPHERVKIQLLVEEAKSQERTDAGGR